MNVAFLAQVYSEYIKPGGGAAAKRAKRYSCWAQTQVCLLLLIPLHAPHTMLRICVLSLKHLQHSLTTLFPSICIYLCMTEQLLCVSAYVL